LCLEQVGRLIEDAFRVLDDGSALRIIPVRLLTDSRRETDRFAPPILSAGGDPVVIDKKREASRAARRLITAH
jgi:hypothetical protein